MIARMVTIALLAWLPAASNVQANEVELELLLAVDTSTSVNAREFRLQRQGYADAFRSQKVQDAIASLGPRGMAVALVQWAGPRSQIMAVDWRVVNSPASADAYAEQLDRMHRQLQGLTDISGILKYARKALLNNRYQGARLAIDVSGDGASDERDPSAERDLSLVEGITINGIIIHSEEYDLGELATIGLRAHYRDRVIGGPGHFLMEVEGFEGFAEAIERKLVREIRGAAFAQMRLK